MDILPEHTFQTILTSIAFTNIKSTTILFFVSKDQSFADMTELTLILNHLNNASNYFLKNEA